VRVIVIGGGVVGLCVAEALASRGTEVIVLERDRCGAGASAGNAGWITLSLAEPVPGPGVIGASLRWLVDPSGPLWIRPTLSPEMVAWIARFVIRCRRGAYERGLTALQLAAGDAVAAFAGLAERGVEFELHDEPLLLAAFGQGELEHVLRIAEHVRAAGSRQRLERVSASELLALEPALSDQVIGGVVAYGEQRVRPERLTAGVHRAVLQRGVEVLEGALVTGLARSRGGWVAESAGGSWRGDAVVIAGGVASAQLLGSLGLRLPLVAAKGYSRTYARVASGPQRPVYLEGPKVAVSVFEGAVRVSGTLELGARGLSLSARRLAAITVAAQRAFPGWEMPPQPWDWAGMRPLSPDGLPFVGAVPGLDGLHLATGHAMLGVTLGPLTGQLIAGQLLDGTSNELLVGFDPGRALRRRSIRAGAAAAAGGGGSQGRQKATTGGLR
jgi:D-amino-acid dehydrogenase